MTVVIKSLHRDYVQKSRIFLYPFLDIKRGVSIIPIQTYVSWEDCYSVDDMKLICLYNLRNDNEFKNFERLKLLDNKSFHDFKQVEGNKGVYVFDFSSRKQTWDDFLIGKYSRFSPEHKKKIKVYTGEASADMPYVDSFLYPEKYYKLYSELMLVEEKLLKEVGELCDPPNIEKETLKISIKNLGVYNKNV